MLSRSTYPKEYVDACRARVEAQVAAYDGLAAAVARSGATRGGTLAAFEPVFFDALVLALDNAFCHRARALEGKDGNPLNEVRVLCASLLLHDGVLTKDTSIKLSPETSVLGIAFGESIALRRAAFTRLAEAFFGAIERTYA